MISLTNRRCSRKDALVQEMMSYKRKQLKGKENQYI
jgi:hypothetical protein